MSQEETNKIIEESKDTLAWIEIERKRSIGYRSIEDSTNEEGKLDRRKVGKFTCGFCSHKFNPFYTKTLRDKSGWSWVWVGCDHKQPEKDYYVNCPKCSEELYFTLYMPQ
jgi:hypothetical protein